MQPSRGTPNSTQFCAGHCEYKGRSMKYTLAVMFRGCPTFATYPFESREEAEAIARRLMAGDEEVVECRGAAGELCLYRSAEVQAVQVFDEIESMCFQARRKLFSGGCPAPGCHRGGGRAIEQARRVRLISNGLCSNNGCHQATMNQRTLTELPCSVPIDSDTAGLRQSLAAGF